MKFVDATIPKKITYFINDNKDLEIGAYWNDTGMRNVMPAWAAVSKNKKSIKQTKYYASCNSKIISTQEVDNVPIKNITVLNKNSSGYTVLVDNYAFNFRLI